MKLEKIQEILSKCKSKLLKKYKAKELGIFGSYAKGRQKKGSDIDILVKFNDKASLFDFLALGNELEEKLKIKVDLVSDKALRAELKDNILREAIAI